MGLDNGIYVVRNDYSEKVPFLSAFREPFDENNEYPFTICYWRKCWGLREDIFRIVENTEDCGDTELSIYDILAIKNLLTTYNEYNWEESIWEWEEICDTIQYQISHLQLLYDLMLAYPDLEVYFYDSY